MTIFINLTPETIRVRDERLGRALVPHPLDHVLYPSGEVARLQEWTRHHPMGTWILRRRAVGGIEALPEEDSDTYYLTSYDVALWAAYHGRSDVLWPAHDASAMYRSDHSVFAVTCLVLLA